MFCLEERRLRAEAVRNSRRPIGESGSQLMMEWRAFPVTRAIR